MNNEPLVSIGIPVFSGAASISRTLESILAQNYTNIEIIVCDNNSPDKTVEIVKNYQKTDKRIKLIQHPQNIGMFKNFNSTFLQSSGEFFMWVAHDDDRSPEFISECLKPLLLNCKAVLCSPMTIAFYKGEACWIASMPKYRKGDRLSSRYLKTLNEFPATAIYGLYRSSAIRKTRLWGQFLGGDIAFIQELSIQGEFERVDVPLFQYQEREQWTSVDQDFSRIFVTSRKPRIYSPYIVFLKEQILSLYKLNKSLDSFLGLVIVLIYHHMSKLPSKIARGLNSKFLPKPYKIRIAQYLYWRFFHNPNVEVINQENFLNRNILPMMRVENKTCSDKEM